MAFDFSKAADAPSAPSEVARIAVAGGDNPPPVVLKDAMFLLSAKYQKAGGDLVLTGPDGQKVVIEGYFNHDNPPDLMAAGGGTVSAELVERLAVPENPGQFAQVGVPAGAMAIGKVERVGGTAVVQHANGVVEELRVGDSVLQGDVVETRDGSMLGLSMNDGTAFNMGTNARMVLNELVYSAGSSSNSGVFSIVKGSIAFVAGQAAKSGEMKIVTPISTMGIRGTTVNTIITTDAFGNTISVVISLMSDPDGGIGRVSIIDPLSDAILATMTSTDMTALVTQAANLSILAQITQKTPEMVQQELAIAQILFPIFLSNPVNFTNLPQPQDLQPRAASIGTPGTVTDTRTITESISVTITQPNPANPNGPPIVTTLPPQDIPVVIPENLAPLITVDTPPHLIEATTANPGVSSSTAMITKSDLDGVANYNFGALAAAGWINNGNGTFSKVGTYGTATLNVGSNTLIYVLDNTKADPLNDGDVAFDLFTIPVIDNSGAGASATATFTIEGATDAPANTAPVAVENVYGVVLGQTLHVLANGVLGNDTDAQNNPLTAQLVSGTTDGVLTFNADGSFDFRPFFNGSTTFTYKANDGSLDSNTATVTIQVSLNASTYDFSTATNDVAVILSNTPGQSFILTGSLGDRTPIADGINNVTGGSGIDFIRGNNSGGILNGGGGNDAIIGGTGNDIIIGGTGSDRLTGGLGDDFFVFRAGFGLKDIVTDFNVGDALHHDTLDLRGLGFTSIADVLNHTDAGPNAIIHVGTDQIELTGITKAMLEVHALNVMMV